MNQILNTNITILLWRHFCKCYSQIEQMSIGLYHNSQTHRLIRAVREKTKICFRYSLFRRVTQLEETDTVILDNSKISQYLINLYKDWKDKIIYYSKTSSTISMAKDTKEQLNFSLAKTISIMLITTIFVNALLLVILQRQLDLWGFLIRILFLFAGVVGLSCEADWPTVKDNSVFLRKTRKD